MLRADLPAINQFNDPQCKRPGYAVEYVVRPRTICQHWNGCLRNRCTTLRDGHKHLGTGGRSARKTTLSGGDSEL